MKGTKSKTGVMQAGFSPDEHPEVISAVHHIVLVTAESPGVSKDKTLVSLVHRAPYLFPKETVCPD